MKNRREWIGLGVFFLAVLVAALIGGYFTSLSVDDWYRGLRKPGFTPPNWVFGPAWTILYILIAIAGWRIWIRRGYDGARRGMAYYVGQLVLNASWSIYFFGIRSPFMGLVVILLLIAAIIGTINQFRLYDKTAAWLLAPYLAWVCYATALNAAIWMMN
ncbi:tryptophan-rich sensory protein [bacterium]|nr:tryptophan-rich sensory protein [bacterium]